MSLPAHSRFFRSPILPSPGMVSLFRSHSERIIETCKRSTRTRFPFSNFHFPLFLSSHVTFATKKFELSFSRNFLVSPTYTNSAPNSFLSPTYAKTGGYPPRPSKMLKSYLQCRNFDILAFSPVFLHFLPKSCSPAQRGYSLLAPSSVLRHRYALNRNYFGGATL
jgi:hypothetical protein